MLIVDSEILWVERRLQAGELRCPDDGRVWEAIGAVGLREAVDDLPAGLDILLSREVFCGSELTSSTPTGLSPNSFTSPKTADHVHPAQEQIVRPSPSPADRRSHQAPAAHRNARCAV
ncbi:hypothetical protein [Streptomyces sp. NPDC048489]|uniref:hypothetical protein n=1 Tax=Streptomyces sp. NPDC048489 TaxID=3154504 RepID=UPI003432955F